MMGSLPFYLATQLLNGFLFVLGIALVVKGSLLGLVLTTISGSLGAAARKARQKYTYDQNLRIMAKASQRYAPPQRKGW